MYLLLIQNNQLSNQQEKFREYFSLAIPNIVQHEF